MITFVIIAISLVVLALSGYLTPLSRLVLTPITSAQTWVSDRYLALRDYITTPRDMAVVTQRNVELEAEVARLEGQIVELQQRIVEYEILSSLLDFARAYPEYKYVGASVIGRDPSPFLRYVIINRGSDDGLRRGMPVVTQQGLVGRIARVTATSANVQLITDAASNINVRLQPSREEAQLTGSLTGDLYLDFIPQEADVEPGALVLTSGLGGN
jgi:rod shape-determining protein MreC